MSNSKDKNLTRFLLTFFLGWIGSIIINNTDLKPNGYKSRTLAYLFLSGFTCGIYGLVASISNLSFDPAKSSNIGYAREEGYVHTSLTNSTQSTISASTASAMPNSIDEKVNSIKTFAELKENGIITQEEFDKMKKKFLDM